MTILYRREGGRGVHALIVGVSAYSKLPVGEIDGPERLLRLRQLQSPALSAFRIADWLCRRSDRLGASLASCRLLIAPSQAELDAEQGLSTLNQGCTFDEFAEAADAWRRDANSHQENITLFYFAGHGAQRIDRSHVMLLQDFGVGAAVFGKAVETDLLLAGMAPSAEFPNIGLNQLYFIDACRVRPHYIMTRELLSRETNPAGALWDGVTSAHDDRSLTLYYAAAAGRTAYSRKGQQTIFSLALLQCLNGEVFDAIGEPAQNESSWRVSTHSLIGALDKQVLHLGAAIKKVQRCRLERLGDDFVMNYLDVPPVVDFSIGVHPDNASGFVRLVIADDGDEVIDTVGAPVEPHPYTTHLHAGIYQARATICPPTPPYVDRKHLFNVQPRSDRRLVVRIT